MSRAAGQYPKPAREARPSSCSNPQRLVYPVKPIGHVGLPAEIRCRREVGGRLLGRADPLVQVTEGQMASRGQRPHASEVAQDLRRQLADSKSAVAERTDLLVRVDYQTVDEFFSEFARNINEGGVFVESDTPHPLGTQAGSQKLPLPPEPVGWVGPQLFSVAI